MMKGYIFKGIYWNPFISKWSSADDFSLLPSARFTRKQTFFNELPCQEGGAGNTQMRVIHERIPYHIWLFNLSFIDLLHDLHGNNFYDCFKDKVDIDKHGLMFLFIIYSHGVSTVNHWTYGYWNINISNKNTHTHTHIYSEWLFKSIFINIFNYRLCQSPEILNRFLRYAVDLIDQPNFNLVLIKYAIFCLHVIS